MKNQRPTEHRDVLNGNKL